MSDETLYDWVGATMRRDGRDGIRGLKNNELTLLRDLNSARCWGFSDSVLQRAVDAEAPGALLRCLHGHLDAMDGITKYWDGDLDLSDEPGGGIESLEEEACEWASQAYDIVSKYEQP